MSFAVLLATGEPLLGQQCVAEASIFKWEDIPAIHPLEVETGERSIRLRFEVIVPPTQSEPLSGFYASRAFVRIDGNPIVTFPVDLKKSLTTLDILVGPLSAGTHRYVMGYDAVDKDGPTRSEAFGCATIGKPSVVRHFASVQKIPQKFTIKELP
ncbi:MAG: hypothetical protein NVSMB31_04540 [Vulcanimicrobiaceae bacterium]